MCVNYNTICFLLLCVVKERTQQGSEGCESQSNKHDQETVQMKEDLKSLKEVESFN